MNKKIIAIAIATAVAAPAAMADVKLSGKGVYAVSSASGSGLTSDQKALGTNDTGARMIIVGSQKAGSGSVYAHLEYAIQTGSSDAATTPFAKQRFNWVGYKGSFGELQLGSPVGPMKGSAGSHDLFADSSGDQNKNFLGYNSMEEASYTKGNTIQYVNKFGGATIKVATQLANADQDGAKDGDTQASAVFKAGPAQITVATVAGGTGLTYKSNHYLGAKMKFGKIDARVQYQANTKNGAAGEKSTVTGIGAAMKAGNGKAKVQMMIRDNKTSEDLTTTSIGYDMGLGKGVGVGISYSMYDYNGATKDAAVFGVGLGFKF